jgi:hypothetical protein
MFFRYVPRLLCLLLLTITFSRPLLAAENSNIPSITPTVVVPFLTAPPTLDGKISSGEWKTLHEVRFVSQNNDLLERRSGEFWIGSDRKTLYIAVRSGVHPQLGTIAKYLPRDTDQDVVFDDAIEIWIDNSPSSSEGQYFQVMVNPNGAIYEARFSHHDKIAQKFWRADIHQAHRVQNGVWTAEIGISLASLGITDPAQPLAMHICRDYKNPWDQARWEAGVHSFDAPETMGHIRFTAEAPVVEELPVQDTSGITVGLTLTNPTSKALPLHVRLGYNAQDQPRYFQDSDMTLAPGETQTALYRKPFFTPDNYPALGEALVTDASGAILYHRDFKWQTHPTDPIWDVVATPNAQQATHFDIAFYPTYHRLRWRASIAALAGREKIRQMRVIVRNKTTQALVAEQSSAIGKDGTVLRELSLPKLASGQYEAALYLDRGQPSVEPIQTAPFTYQTEFVWKNNRLGMDDVVIPPFTPLARQGRVVSAILRRHVMADNGLWSQVNALGEDILSGPMRLEVRQGGQSVPVMSKLTFGSHRPTSLVASSVWSAGTLRGRTTSVFDYDGCMKVTLDLPPSGKTPIESLDLVIPLKDNVAPLMHACGEGLRSNYGGFVPPGEGTVWTSLQASRDQLLGTFLPYLWVGGPERGLVWFASNDRDWLVDDSGKAPALALERHGGTLTLRIRLVQKPSIWTNSRHIVFGLQATPVKPMPADPDWRLRGLASGGKFETHLLGMSMYWGADLYGIFPRGRDYKITEKIAQAQKQGKRDDAFFDTYLAHNPDIRAEVNSVSGAAHVNAIIPYTNLRGDSTSTPEWLVYQDEWRRTDFSDRAKTPIIGSIDFSLTPVPSRQDYLLYYYKQLLMHGFDGIYFDNICIYDNSNPVTGNGYTRGDGQFQPDTDIWQLRALTKRTATMMYQMGRRNLTLPHMTNAYLIPVFSWTTMDLDWEMHYGGSDFQDRFTRDYIQAASLGRQGGNMPIILPGITEVTDPAKQAWVERTRAGVCLPYEISVYQADPLYIKIKAYLYSLGYGTRACHTDHSWDKAPVLSVQGIDSAWIAFENHDTVAVVVTDYGNGGTAQLTLDTKRLGLPENFAAANWEKPSEMWTAMEGILTVPNIAKHDFRLLIISKTNRLTNSSSLANMKP